MKHFVYFSKLIWIYVFQLPTLYINLAKSVHWSFDITCDAQNVSQGITIQRYARVVIYIVVFFFFYLIISTWCSCQHAPNSIYCKLHLQPFTGHFKYSWDTYNSSTDSQSNLYLNTCDAQNVSQGITIQRYARVVIYIVVFFFFYLIISTWCSCQHTPNSIYCKLHLQPFTGHFK